MFCEESRCKNYIDHHSELIEGSVTLIVKCRACPNPQNEFKIPISHEWMLKKCSKKRVDK